VSATATTTVPTDLSPRSTLAIILGASAFPKTDLSHPPSFETSARRFREYLTRDEGLGLAGSNVLDLFDTNSSPDQIQVEIADFLSERRVALESQGAKPRDLIFYYVGHGSFSNPDQQYILAVRATRKNFEGVSSVKIIDLGTTLTEAAFDLRRYLILDCCFAAAAVKSLQAPVTDIVHQKTIAAFPASGTTLLCASDAHDAAEAPPDLTETVFSGALLSILLEGEPSLETGLSMYALGNLVRNRIRERYKNHSGLPEVHSPIQIEGNIATIPLFPNAVNRPRHLKEQIEGLSLQIGQTRSTLESFTRRLSTVESTSSQLSALQDILTTKITDFEEELRSLPTLRSRIDALESRRSDVMPPEVTSGEKSDEERILQLAPRYVVDSVYRYRNALFAGRLWGIITFVIVSLSVGCLLKSYSFFGIPYRYDPLHWVPVVLFLVSSIMGFISLRYYNWSKEPSEETQSLHPWVNLPSVVAANNARYVMILLGLKVVSPYFELACLLYLVQFTVFIARFFGVWNVKSY
jgi:hypothetical protein